MNELKVVENKEEIVIYNNDLNTKVYLKKFNNFNWDIFMIVVSALAYTKNGVAEISLVEIKKKTNYTSQNNENFKNKLKETNRKILQSVCEIETGEDTEQFPLFKKFKIIGKKSLRVEVGEDYMSFFTDYSEYTSFGLKTFLTLKNKYMKPLFKELMQFKATGKAFFRMEDFRNKLDIPNSLSFSKIRDRILIPSIQDFSVIFKNYKIIAKVLDGEEIEISENMSDEAKKDRRQVTNINFFFVLTKKEDIIAEREVVSNQASINDKKDIEVKEEIDYLKLIKEFLKGQDIDYKKVETNINFLLENYTSEEIYREIIRINNIKNEKASIDPKKYLIASINNLDKIKNDCKQDESIKASYINTDEAEEVKNKGLINYFELYEEE